MKIGNVIGSIQALRAAPCLQGQSLLLVRIGDEEVAAVDLAGAAVGDCVLIATGPAAMKFCMDTPADAVIAAVVEKETGKEQGML